ncbi:DUF2079 domain-containing protein [Kitasatospora sp. NPDC086801]|uniref:DUF2079 domain-containing protein n=1 Tax=Kitasatospora sp. NPDC086801 TaxID=3364066 RepID=UPI00380D3E18
MPLSLIRATRATVGTRPVPERRRSAAPGARTALLPWALAAVLFAAYTALSVSRHLHLRTNAFDLGIFEQAVRGYAEGRAPVSELKGPGFHLLGDHFHPILATLAPLYRLLPSPLTLLVAQAVLFAVSAVPVTRAAVRAAGRWAGAGIGVAYGLSVGLQQAVAFDFHEIAFAVPLLAFSLERLMLRQWRSAVGFALPLLLVKEDLAATVAVVGCYLFWHGRRRLGTGVVALAVATVALVVLVVIPALNPDGVYTYLSNVDGPSGDPVGRLFLPAQKWGTVAVLLAPTAFLALRSPLILLALPTLGWRFWSTNPVYWGTGFHYGAVLMPIVFIAFADALTRLRFRLRARHGLRRWTVRGSVAVGLAVTAAALPAQPLAELARPATWQRDATVDAVSALLRRIPDGAEVAAPNGLAAQLTGRTRVYLFPRYPGGPGARPDWVVAADRPGDGLLPARDEAEALRSLPVAGYRPVASAAGLTVYRLTDPAG